MELKEVRDLIFDKVSTKLNIVDEGKRYFNCAEFGILHIFWIKNQWSCEWINKDDIIMLDKFVSTGT